MYVWEAQVVVYIYRSTWAGFYVAYPYEGAMRRPDFRDRHGETFSHVFFVSMVFLAVVKNGEYD
jgi:hypothetical protein